MKGEVLGFDEMILTGYAEEGAPVIELRTATNNPNQERIVITSSRLIKSVGEKKITVRGRYKVILFALEE